MLENQDVPCKIKKIFYSSDKFSAGSLLPVLQGKTGDIEVKFKIFGRLQEGDNLIVKGKWITDTKYGKTFQIDNFSYNTKLDSKGLIEYISKCKEISGVGPAKAKKFVESLKDVEDIFNQDAATLSKSSKLPLEVCAEIQKQLKSKRLHTEVLGQLQGFDITFNSINKLIERYGPNTLHILHTDPYSIIGNVPGFAFKKVDGIALKFGVDPKCNKRIDEAILYLLRNGVSEGNSYLDEDYIKDEANKILHIDTLDAKEIVNKSLKRLLLTKAVVKHRNAIVLPGVWEKEVWLSKWLSESKANIYTKGVDIGRLFEVAPFISLNEGQRKAILDFLKYDRLVITGGAGVGKAQPLDALVLTPDGYKTMGEVKVGDQVCTPCGNRAIILQEHPQGEQDVYKITFSDKSSTECTLDHLWDTQTEQERKRHKPYTTKKTSEILTSLFSRKGTRRYNHSIPMLDKISFNNNERYLISPYLMGLLIGDGGLSVGVNLTSVDQEIIQFLKEETADEARIVNAEYNPDTYHIRGKEGLDNVYLEEIRRLGLCGTRSHTKFIPDIYKYASEEIRVGVLQGLIDSDGYITLNGHNIEISTVSKQLSEDITFLVQSLGGTTSCAEVYKTFTHKEVKKTGKLTYRMLLKLPNRIAPCRLTRKLSRHVPKTKYVPKRYIDKIEYVGKKECKCISISAKDGLYITNNFIVTHNSFLTNSILKICESLNLNTVLCSPTGKAAKRLEHYTGRRAHTIHKLLGFMGDTYKLDSPLLTNGRVFIVDEVSMCGTELLYILLTSIPPNSIVVLIGDANQLPPVDYGTTLKDAIVYYPIPKAILTECHRQAGELKENCNIILSGKIPKTSDNYIGDTKKKPWYKITSYTTHETIRDYLVQIYTHSIKDKFNYDILKDVQLLTPTHKGPLGTIELNRLLQVTVQQTIYNNPIALQSGLGRTKFYVGDKVINKKNNYDKEIMNGTIGLVKEITTKDFIIVNFEGRDVILENDELDHLYLAYALTVHSYQGDQIPMAIFLCHKSHHYQHSRNLVYTAATRAQQSFVILGDIWAITNCAIELSAYNRNSLLPLLK